MTKSLGEQSRGAIAWMTHNRVTPNLLMLFFIIGGLLMSWQIKKEVHPNHQHNSVRIWVYYPGSTPTEMEQGITLPIENAISGIEGIKEIVWRRCLISPAIHIALQTFCNGFFS